MTDTPFLDQLLALTPQTPEASTVPKPIGRPNGPGLWHHKHWQLPPYIQHVAHALMRHGHGESDAIHMAVGLSSIVKNWAKGHDGHGHRTHADVRAAAAGNVAKWEQLRASAHAHHAMKEASKGSKHDHALAASADQIGRSCLEIITLAAEAAEAVQLAAPRGTSTRIYERSMLKDGTIFRSGQNNSAPGAKMISTTPGLYQVPSQTVQAGPPLPPGVTLPSPDELEALCAHIKSGPVTDGNSDLMRGAAAHAHAAATKMRNNQPVDALHALRSCMTGLTSARRQFQGSQLPVANVFSSSIVPAEQSSARSEMFEGLATREAFRKLQTECGQNIDRIRRHIFHGMYNRMATARL